LLANYWTASEIENLNTQGNFPLDISDWREKEIESVLAKNPDIE